MTTVDHDERRRQIAETTVAVIAREGLEAATIRRIAAELNGPTKLVTHYFHDKNQLLVWVYQSLAFQWDMSVRPVLQRDPADLLGLLCTMVPSDERQTRLWRVYVAFWDRASRDPTVAGLQRNSIQKALQILADSVRALTGDQADMQSICERLNAVAQGLAIQALMDPDRWPLERVRQRLAETIDCCLGVQSRSG
jgi:TetR/AcrR family transcriptional regulator, transcriptional repressor of bet genes